jgi:hypothetical protein
VKEDRARPEDERQTESLDQRLTRRGLWRLGPPFWARRRRTTVASCSDPPSDTAGMTTSGAFRSLALLSPVGRRFPRGHPHERRGRVEICRSAIDPRAAAKATNTGYWHRRLAPSAHGLGWPKAVGPLYPHDRDTSIAAAGRATRTIRSTAAPPHRQPDYPKARP